jgi:hypothetical protein
MPLGCRHKDLHFIRFYGLWDPDNCEHEILKHEHARTNHQQIIKEYPTAKLQLCNGQILSPAMP